MKKLTGALALVTLLFIFSASPAFAHTHLDSSDPEEGSTVTESPENITLNFETVIEESAVLELQKEDGTEIALDNITVNDNELSAGITEPLENGAYTLSWDIIGVDGHPMEDFLSFEVEIEETAAEDNTDEQKDEEAVDEQAAENEAASESDVQDTTEDAGSSNTLLITILLVAIIAVVAIVLLKRKK